MTYKVYHGTPENFKEFQCPAYFSSTYETADFFSKIYRNGTPKVLFCEISLDNPLIIDLHGQSWGGFFLDNEQLQGACIAFAADGDEEEIEYLSDNGLSVGHLADYAREEGYDGVIIHNCEEENGISETQYVVFESEKIKILRKMRSRIYKLRFYRKSGASKGNTDHEEVFKTRSEMIRRYKEVFAYKDYSLNPTAWCWEKGQWIRISEKELNL